MFRNGHFRQGHFKARHFGSTGLVARVFVLLAAPFRKLAPVLSFFKIKPVTEIKRGN